MSRSDTAAEPRNLAQIILRNTLIVTLSRWVMKFGSFLYAVYVIRTLNEIGFGAYTSALAFVGMFGVFCELGLTQYAERAIAQDRSRTQSLFWNLVALRLILASLGVLGITGLSLASAHTPLQTLLVFLATLTFFPAGLLAPLTTLLTANERFDLSSAMQIVGQVLTIIVGAGMLLSGAGVVGLMCVGLIVMPIQIVVTLTLAHRHGLGPQQLQIRLKEWPAFIRAALPFGLTSLALTFNFHADTVILSQFRTVAEVGWYNVAYGLVFTLVSVADGVLTTMTPSLAREHVQRAEAVQQWIRAGVRWLIVLALPAAMGVSLLAMAMITFLYGQNFLPAAPVLMVIAWDIPLLLFTAFCGNVAAAVALERPAARLYLTSAILNVVLNLAFIPIYGMLAAAVVTLITDGLTAFLFYRLLHDRMALGTLNGVVLRCVLATIIMGAVVWLASTLPLAVPIVLGALVYGGLAWRFGVVDTAALMQRVRRRSADVAAR